MNIAVPVDETCDRFKSLNPMLDDPILNKVKRVGRQIREKERQKTKVMRRLDAIDEKLVKLIEREKRLSKMAP